ncbi:hypothetical protein ACWET9_48100 [Streptomyces sp. NPDC004059]
MPTSCCTLAFRPTARWTQNISPCAAFELIVCWAELLTRIPPRPDPIDYLARATGISRHQLLQARTARNRCAHPHSDPLTSTQLARALDTVHHALAALP